MIISIYFPRSTVNWLHKYTFDLLLCIIRYGGIPPTSSSILPMENKIVSILLILVHMIFVSVYFDIRHMRLRPMNILLDQKFLLVKEIFSVPFLLCVGKSHVYGILEIDISFYLMG